jgi:hypothetical protein
MVVKRLDRLRDIVRSDEKHLTFKEWIIIGTWVNYAVYAM